VKSLAESLSHDLKSNDPLKPVALDVHLLVPGWTYTGLSGAEPGSVEGKPAGAWAPDQVVEFLVEKMAKRDFYVICPDNEVTEAMDRKRMLFGTGDMVEGRPPLSRWREGWKDKADEWLKKDQ
jgi:short-subunit dehydrogenase